MKLLILIGKLAGSAAIAFGGYFLYAAEGWPEPLESMSLERTVVGGAFVLLGVLCAIASLMPERHSGRHPRPQGLVLDGTDRIGDRQPFWAEEPAAASEPEAPVERTREAIAAPIREPEPATQPASVEQRAPAALEPEPPLQPQPDPSPEVQFAHQEERAVEPDPPAPPSAHPSSIAAARALLAKGDAAFGEGRVDEAMEPYDEAVSMARDLHRAAPGDDTEHLLADALKSLGDSYDEGGRLDAALAAYQEARDLREARLAAAPDDPERIRALSLVLERMGDTREARGHTTRALDLYRSSLPLAEKLAALAPDNPVYAEDLAATRKRLSEIEARLAAPL